MRRDRSEAEDAGIPPQGMPVGRAHLKATGEDVARRVAA